MATQINQPNVSVSIAPATQLVSNQEQRILVIGQKTTGSAADGSLTTNILNDNSWNNLFGADSMLSGLCRNVRKYNQESAMDALCLADNGAGVAATGQIAFTGTATAAGSYTFTIGSDDFEVVVPVAVGDTAASLATALAAGITALTECPVDAAATLGDCDLTAVNDGTVGNSIPLRVNTQVAGITVAITGMSGGSADPSFTNIFDVVANNRYQTVIWPYADDIDTVKDWLDARFNVTGKVLDGVAFVGIDDSKGDLETEANTHNSQSVVIIGDEQISKTFLKGGAITEIPYAKAAQFGSIRALRNTDGASIGQFVIAREGALDRFGGMALASLPYFNTPLPQLPLIDPEDGFSDAEIEDLFDAGVTVLGNNIANSEVIAGEVVTTYKTDTAGNPDVSFKFLNYVDTSSAIREYFFNNLRARFAQSRLTEGAVIPGRAMANPAIIEAYITSLYQELADNALVQYGEDALNYFKENLLVTVDLSTGTVTVQMKTPIVTQLRVILATMQISFSVEG